MSADTAPASVPGPTDSNRSGSPTPGMFASMLAPVDPARPAVQAFDLTPTAAAPEAADTPVTGASSASYHGDGEAAPQNGAASGSGQKKGIWRAWLLAGAARWGKGGGAENKRLDLAKVKAQARQLKETRQVSVNRSDAPAGKTPAASGTGTKSLDSKRNPGNTQKAPQNSNGSAHKGANGPSGSGNRGPAGGTPAGKNTGPAPKSPKASDAGGRSPKMSKGEGSRGGPSATGSGGGKSGTQGPAGGTGKNGNAGTARGSTGGSKGAGAGPADGRIGDSGKTPAPKHGKDPCGGGKNSGGKTPGANGAKAGTDTDTAGSAGKNGTSTAGPTPRPGTGGGRPGGTSGPAAASKGDKVSKPGQEPNPAQTGPQDGKPFSLRQSREAGYHDGALAARMVAQAKAYRDGTKDGWTDTAEAADREKARLDQKHQDRKKDQQDQRDRQEQPVSGSSADYHKPAEPIEVTGVTPTHVLLGAGADVDSMTRGEVRSLKSFERRLKAKTESMAKIAEGTKGLKAHAEEQAKKATWLLGEAKAREGGEKLAAALTKLEEAAKAQASKAEEIYKRSVRAAEGCRVVLTNAETRYGGMYQAVVDSDETAPAELAFYKG